MPYASPHLPPGTKLANGRYSVGKVLGQGGFGITYKGADLSLNRPVAIKEFFPDGSSRHTTLLVPPTSFGNQGLREALNNFLDEARTLAQFNHPAIVDVLDVFEENFTAYLVMELLQGETLGARIQERGKLTPEEVTTLAVNMASALSVVHHAGLLHRDIKPDNIFLTTDGRAVLIDFGSARAYAGGQTVSHTRLVTPGYAPLEQYTSQAKFGPYTDIYA
ncbi:MAG: serine/threonine protein kinase, partial [Deinococcota bacterium]|nr:serine/threonine protein kinase [Deinococcota bacterium]